MYAYSAYSNYTLRADFTVSTGTTSYPISTTPPSPSQASCPTSTTSTTTTLTYTTNVTVATITPNNSTSTIPPSPSQTSSPTLTTATATTYRTDVTVATSTPNNPTSAIPPSPTLPTTNPTPSTALTSTALSSPLTVSPPSKVTQLYNGTGVSVSGARGSSFHYKIRLPGNTRMTMSQSLVVVLAGGQGDPDLYIQKGRKATRALFLAKSFKDGSSEEIRTGDLDIRNSSMYNFQYELISKNNTNIYSSANLCCTYKWQYIPYDYLTDRVYGETHISI